MPSQARPKAIVLAGQPGAGKGTAADNALADLKDQAVVIDPDELRRLHPDFNPLKERYPYTWADHTHADASQWAKELRADAIAQRKNIIIDGTMPKADVIKSLLSEGYDVEIRALATHRLESKLGVDARFANGLDRDSFIIESQIVGREVKDGVDIGFEKLFGTHILDVVQKMSNAKNQILFRLIRNKNQINRVREIVRQITKTLCVSKATVNGLTTALRKANAVQLEYGGHWTPNPAVVFKGSSRCTSALIRYNAMGKQEILLEEPQQQPKPERMAACATT